MPKFLDLFAGAGGLSEGFIQAGYTPVAHVEMDTAACYTLKTRAAFHWLKDNENMELYHRYLRGEIKRDEFYSNIPQDVLDTVLNYEISDDTIPEIFTKVDQLLDAKEFVNCWHCLIEPIMLDSLPPPMPMCLLTRIPKRKC